MNSQSLLRNSKGTCDLFKSIIYTSLEAQAKISQKLVIISKNLKVSNQYPFDFESQWFRVYDEIPNIDKRV